MKSYLELKPILKLNLINTLKPLSKNQCSLEIENQGKTGDSHSDDLSALLKNRTQNNKDDLVVGQKRLISNNDDSNNIPTKFPFCLYPNKVLSDVDLVILDQADQTDTKLTSTHSKAS